MQQGMNWGVPVAGFCRVLGARYSQPENDWGSPLSTFLLCLPFSSSEATSRKSSPNLLASRRSGGPQLLVFTQMFQPPSSFERVYAKIKFMEAARKIEPFSDGTPAMLSIHPAPECSFV